MVALYVDMKRQIVYIDTEAAQSIQLGFKSMDGL
jgi:hypothetical protein